MAREQECMRPQLRVNSNSQCFTSTTFNEKAFYLQDRMLIAVTRGIERRCPRTRRDPTTGGRFLCAREHSRKFSVSAFSILTQQVSSSHEFALILHHSLQHPVEHSVALPLWLAIRSQDAVNHLRYVRGAPIV